MAQTIKANWGESNIPAQAGRVVLVTGANNGLGYEASRMLAGKGARVVMACRNSGLGAKARGEILALHPNAAIDLLTLDLADLDSVAAVPGALKGLGIERLDVLLNNAGVMMPGKRLTTKQGFELQFGTNHLGHFALTRDLFPMLAADGRVVTVASIADRRGNVKFDDLQWEKSYSPAASYGQSKTANLLFTLELSRRLAAAGSGIRAVAAHPGISRTNLISGSFLANYAWLLQIIAWLPVGPKFQPAAMGALPEVYGATGEIENGAYYGPRDRVAGYPIRAEAHMAPWSNDADAAKKLWGISEELTGGVFNVG